MSKHIDSAPLLADRTGVVSFHPDAVAVMTSTDGGELVIPGGTSIAWDRGTGIVGEPDEQQICLGDVIWQAIQDGTIATR